MGVLEQIINETEAQPFASIGGVDVYTFEEGAKKNRKILAEEKLNGKVDELGDRELQKDGIHYTRSKTNVKVVNPSRYFDNRFRQINYDGKKAIEVVVDYRAIQGQESGQIYTTLINTYIFGEKYKKLAVIGKSKVTDIEFGNEFKNAFDLDSAKQIFALIEKEGLAKESGAKITDIFG